MTNIQYPLTLAAAKKGESSLWEIGDALLKECPLDSERGKIIEAARYLRENGCDYSETRLRELRTTAAAFPVKYRRVDISFTVYNRAGKVQ